MDLIKYVNDSDLESLKENKLALLYISAVWCGPCKQLGPKIEELSKKFYDKLVVGKMDADANLDYLKGVGIKSIPTLIFYKDGVEVERFQGNKEFSVLEEIVYKYDN